MCLEQHCRVNVGNQVEIFIQTQVNHLGPTALKPESYGLLVSTRIAPAINN